MCRSPRGRSARPIRRPARPLRARAPAVRRFGERFEMRLHGRGFRYGVENRALDLLGDRMRVVEAERAGKLEVEGDLRPAVDRQHVDVVHLAHVRHVKRRVLGPLADLSILCGLRLDVDDDIGLGERAAHGFLDVVCRCMTLRDGRAGRDPDHDVDKVPPCRLPQSQPAQGDTGYLLADRLARGRGRVGRRAVHEHVDVPPDQPDRRGDDEDGNEERRHRVALRPAEGSSSEPREDGNRAHQIASEVQRVREQRGARIAPRRSQRDGRPRDVDDDHRHDDHERPPRSVDLRLDHTRQAGGSRTRPRRSRRGRARPPRRAPPGARPSRGRTGDRGLRVASRRRPRRRSAARRSGPCRSGPLRRSGRGCRWRDPSSA